MSGAAEAAAEAPRVAGTRLLIGVNAATILLALIFEWPLMTLLLPYWLQSLIIGYYSRKRMLALDRFSTEGFRVGGREVEATEQTKRSTANFFILYYGFFHLVYLAFLARGIVGLELLDWLGIGAACASFAWNHQQSFLDNAAADRLGKPSIGMLMFLPFLRVAPMHLIILLLGPIGPPGPFAVLLFGIFKTIADVLMHIAEHRILRRGAAIAAART